MNVDRLKELFTNDTLNSLFPEDRADQFFDALFGDASEGAFDINLEYDRAEDGAGNIHFKLMLIERPGKCLACNLTYGLPEVFSRHPIININGVVQEIDKLLGDDIQCTGWKLGSTISASSSLHIIPVIVSIS
ncbi:MAG: pancreas/duodenum homeobox protein 1 [Desulfobulbaceae bacterium]|nr:pancreas/duodenum homeobox protein 1 [Desulfobulbaceae bacterium]MCK5405792.1 pancreas/duodenum homeobox protein 1 [Desulfobulbaceae bacterium]